MPKVEKILLVALGVLLLPTLLYTLFLAQLAWREGARFREAPPLPAEGRLAGAFYSLDGEVGGALLEPTAPELQAARGALQIRTIKEIRRTGGVWEEDPATVELQRTEAITIAGVPVALDSGTRFVMPIETARHEQSPTERLFVSWRPGVGQRVTAWGVYERGTLREGTHDRLLIVDQAQVATVLGQIEDAGRIKAAVLGAIAAVLALIIAVVARNALRTPKAA